MNLKEEFKKIEHNYKKIIIALVVFIGIFVVLIVLSGQLNNENIKMYDLTKGEFSMVRGEILYSSTYNAKKIEEINNIEEIFLKNYGKYLESGKMPWIIFGNNEKINKISYDELNQECLCEFNEGPYVTLCSEVINNPDCNRISVQSQNIYFYEGSKKENNVVINLKEQEYHFKLGTGQNFYFVVLLEDR